MISITLLILSHKLFDDMTRELIREKIDIASHARHHAYTKIKKGTRVIG